MTLLRRLRKDNPRIRRLSAFCRLAVRSCPRALLPLVSARFLSRQGAPRRHQTGDGKTRKQTCPFRSHSLTPLPSSRLLSPVNLPLFALVRIGWAHRIWYGRVFVNHLSRSHDMKKYATLPMRNAKP